MKENVNILHITDLHFGVEPNPDHTLTALARRELVLNSLIKHIETNFINESKPDIIVISGDIGWAGKKNDYTQAKEWINKLLISCNLSTDDLVVCAGNHDIDRVTAAVANRPPTTDKADKDLEIEKIKLLENHFTEFINFCNDLNINNLQIGNKQSKLVGIIEKKGLKFLILNSSWFCRDNDDDGKLYIGKPHLEILAAHKQILDKTEYNSTTLTIGVLHHPSESLNDAEINSRKGRINVFNYLTERSHMVLCGHKHGECKEPDRIAGHAYLFRGGAGYSGNDYANNVSLIKIDIKERKAKKICIEFDSSNQEWKKLLNQNNFEYNLKIEKVLDANKNPFAISTFEYKSYPLFSGREIEFEEFKKFASQNEIVPVIGNGGIGKTEFIVKFLNDNFSDKKIIYFECSNGSNIDSIIEYCGQSELLKAKTGLNSEEEVINQTLLKHLKFKDFLENNEMYLVIDNYQLVLNTSIIGFIEFYHRRSKKSKIIIISQENLLLKGIIIPPFQIKELDEKSSLEYINKLIKNNSAYNNISVKDNELKPILSKIEYHPLAINFIVQLLSYNIKPEAIFEKIVKSTPKELSNRLLFEIFQIRIVQKKKKNLC